MSEYILRTNMLTKEYKKQKAVNNVNLNIKKGAIYGFIGRNGAGKTTFLKMISGLATPTRGEIELFGYSGKDLQKVRDRLGTLVETPGLYPGMNGFDNLKLKAVCMGLYRKSYIAQILKLVGLEDVGNKKVKNFSLGMKQRLGIGMALIGEPDLLVLDEPINGLDPQGIVEIRETILRLNSEKNITVIISSHILEELSKLVTHYGIIHQGSLLEELTREELMEKCSERIEIVTSDTEKACTVLEGLGVKDYKVINKETIYVMEGLDDVSIYNKALVTEDIPVTSIRLNRESLESYFMNLTGGCENA